MRLENNFRKALALEKQRMNEDLELQVGYITHINDDH